VPALAVAGGLIAAGTPAACLADGASARIARVLSVRDEGHLHFTRSSGSQIIDEGFMSGTLHGSTRVHFTYSGEPTVSARFTVYGSGWSMSGYASGRLNNPSSANPSFRGSLTLTGGSGRYAHAHGSGEMFGVFNRRTYGLIVQAIGRLHY
jgi:hypothetical protein